MRVAPPREARLTFACGSPRSSRLSSQLPFPLPSRMIVPVAPGGQPCPGLTRITRCAVAAGALGIVLTTVFGGGAAGGFEAGARTTALGAGFEATVFIGL